MSFRPIWGRPRLVNDWGEEQEERETHWTALFYDLIVVAAVFAISDPFVELEEEGEGGEGGGLDLKGGFDLHSGMLPDDASSDLFPLPEIHRLMVADALLKFLSILMMWNHLAEFYSRFDDESLAGHIAFFVHCYGMACSTAGCVGRLDDDYASLGRGICISRIGLMIMHIRPALYIARSRPHCMLKAFVPESVVVVAIYAALAMGVSVGGFRWLLLGVILWDWICAALYGLALLKDLRLPVHVGVLSDRVKDGIMVIFGEAILMLALKPRVVGQHETHYYYTALALALWLVYSMALHEYHIYPSIEDHALRRSVLAGLAWLYLSYALQCSLLGAAIGVKRVYVLVGAGVERVDDQTVNLLVWSITGVLLCVIAMRFCHFGLGRHPSPHDPKLVAAMKNFWWISMVVMSSLPYVLSKTAMAVHAGPIGCLTSLSVMMGVIILLEAALSNGVIYFTSLCTGGGAGSRSNKCLQSFGSVDSQYGSIREENYLRITQNAE